MALLLKEAPEKKVVVPQQFFVTIPQQNIFALKRGLDVIVAIILLFLSAPLFVLIPLFIKLSSPGPVMFKQRRAGLLGKPFVMYKFRSMISNAEQLTSELFIFNMMNGPVFKMKNDPRVTKVGKFLRKTSLDELPQLWNVLKGEMSMVGPRPLPLTEVKTHKPKERIRLAVKPGLTCFWQIKGRSHIVDFDRWFKLDMAYIRNASFKLDMKILLQTIPAVITGLGAE